MDEAAFLAKFRCDAGTRAAHPGRFAPPALPATWERFGEMLAKVGGTLLPAAGGEALRTAIQAAIDLDPTDHLQRGRCVASRAATAHLAGITGWEAAGDPARPHAWADVGLAIIAARTAVAENGAVLIDSTILPERALPFLAQRVLVLVPADALVGDHITAQRALPVPPPHHLTWMSGPSKTADIEQTLVIGAHAARALAVLPVPAG